MITYSLGGSTVAQVNQTLLDEIRDPIDGRIRIACDSEFQGATTLTTQFAAKVGGQIFVQLYRSPVIPAPPPLDLIPLIDRLTDKAQPIVLRPVRELTSNLSPALVLADLFGLHDLRPLGRAAVPEPAGRIEPIKVELIAHHWPADFFRVFGSEYFRELLRARVDGKAKLFIWPHKLISFRDARRRFRDPVLEYAMYGFGYRPIEVRMMDTNLPFGKARLEDHGRTFLGVGKFDVFSAEEKRRMLNTFHLRPADACQYAIWDPVLTLCLAERMREADRRMYVNLGFDDADIPALRPTQGSRVAEMTVRSIIRDVAAGSVRLSKRGKRLKTGAVGKTSMSKVKTLLVQGSGEQFTTSGRSRFGLQTGETHGGLLYTRSPDQFFHDATGQLRDVDLSGCYGHILERLNLYAGRPVTLEPGAEQMTLKQAVAFMERSAAGRDAWILKVTGPIKSYPNVLIPSTKDALTSTNYKSRAARRRVRHRRHGFVFDWVFERTARSGNTAIYTDVIEGGVVCWATWLMIQALPDEWRREYEALEVDTILFYPARLVANNGPGYDCVVSDLERPEISWSSTLDIEELRQVTIERLDAEYATLKFPIGNLARRIQELREAAKRDHGTGSGAEQGWKLQVNSMYGVTASKYLVTNNVILANVITGTARALAFAMSQSLNAIQTITDGCTYRRDEIPAGTLADCLAITGDYSIQRPDDRVAFLNPNCIPHNEAEFNQWYKAHVMRFFNISGPDYDLLFGMHTLEHKRAGPADSPAFDALCCDGSANYVKLLRSSNQWVVLEHKARSYSKAAKSELAPWIVQTYSLDQYSNPPPVTSDVALLTYKEAVRTATKALRALATPNQSETQPEVIFPLGFERQRPQSYRLIRESAFLFRSPDQAAKIRKQMDKFAESCGCGLEVLSLRRSRQGRRRGSIRFVAKRLYTLSKRSRPHLTILNLLC